MTEKVPGNFTGDLPDPQGARRRRGGGVILIVIGVLAILLQTNVLRGNLWPQLFIPALGLIFLLWGMLARRGGLLIPGGILLGLGAGAVLSTTLFENAKPETQSGIVLTAFGLGWALITLTSAITTERTMWWALIPGGILLVLGVIILLGVMASAVQYINWLWPIILIVIGLLIIFRRR